MYRRRADRLIEGPDLLRPLREWLFLSALLMPVGSLLHGNEMLPLFLLAPPDPCLCANTCSDSAGAVDIYAAPR